MTQRLIFAAHLSATTICLAIVGFQFLNLSRQAPRAPAAPESGVSLRNSSALTLGHSQKALILATASSCHYCKESMPFYQRLSGIAKAAGVRIVAVSWEDPSVNASYLKGYNVPVDAVMSEEESAIDVPGTPMIILARKDGSVIKSWMGMLEPKSEASLLEEIQRPD